MTQAQYIYPLDELPAGATLHSVTATPVVIEGRAALRVSLTDDVTFNGIPDVDYHDEPTFVRIPAGFESGSVEFDVRSRLNAMAPEYARAFAGLAYRISEAGDRFECVYLRPMNGRALNPPGPRALRAAQYFVYPEWKFDRLREVYPDGPFEAGADILPDNWIHVRVEIHDRSLLLRVDGQLVLHIEQTLAEPIRGDLGLWVDIGTEAYFANLVIAPAAP